MENPQKSNQQFHRSNFTSLPIELKHDILSRLPSKPLHISRCVSKQWNSIITSPEFTHYFHTLHSLSSPHSNRLLVVDSFRNVFSLELDNENEPIISKHSTITLPEGGTSILIAVGTCNGLVCYSENTLGTLKERLFVYNPFTRRLWTAPTSQDFDSRLCSYGFGYDPSADDYKIMSFPGKPIRMDGLVVQSPIPNDAYLFSLRSWSWKRVDDFPYRLSDLSHGCSRPCLYMDGHLHWIVVLGDGNNRHGSTGIGIGWFNLSSEEYSLMELPEVVLSNVPRNCSGSGHRPGFSLLEVFEGRLSLQVMLYGRDGNHNFDVWVMEEYGISESWKRLFRIGYSSQLSGEKFHLVGMMVMAYSTCRDRILVVRDLDLYWYDTEGKVLELAWGHGLRDGIHVSFAASIVCAGTLISPYCGDEEGQLG